MVRPARPLVALVLAGAVLIGAPTAALALTDPGPGGEDARPRPTRTTPPPTPGPTRTATPAPGPTATAPPTAAPSPTFPAAPVAVDILPTRATLTWQPPNTAPPVTYYRVYRVTVENGQPVEQFYNASYTTSLVLALLTPDTAYTFFVETGDQTSNGLRSPWTTFRTPPAPVESQPPTAPGTPAVSGIGPNSASLTWAASTDNFGVAAYYLYRIRFDGVTEVAGTTVTETTWTFSRLLPDFDYRYFVVAVDHTGNRSAPSPTVAVRTTPNPNSSCLARITATDNGNGTYSGLITLRNTGSYVDIYTIRMTVPAGQQVTVSWSLAFAQAGTEVVFWYDGWAGGLPTGDRTVQFTATGSAANPPGNVRLNGQACGIL